MPGPASIPALARSLGSSTAVATLATGRGTATIGPAVTTTAARAGGAVAGGSLISGALRTLGVIGLVGGAVAGALVGASLLLDGVDRTRERIHDLLAGPAKVWRSRSQAWLVIRNLDKPWLVGLARDVQRAAEAHELARFGSRHRPDDDADATRHAFASALLALRLQRDHGMEREEAEALALDAGRAHETDGRTNTDLAHRMDLANNASGIALLGDARTADGAYIDEVEVARRIDLACTTGQLVRIDGDRLVPTGARSGR